MGLCTSELARASHPLLLILVAYAYGQQLTCSGGDVSIVAPTSDSLPPLPFSRPHLGSNLAQVQQHESRRHAVHFNPILPRRNMTTRQFTHRPKGVPSQGQCTSPIQPTHLGTPLGTRDSVRYILPKYLVMYSTPSLTPCNMIVHPSAYHAALHKCEEIVRLLLQRNCICRVNQTVCPVVRWTASFRPKRHPQNRKTTNSDVARLQPQPQV